MKFSKAAAHYSLQSARCSDRACTFWTQASRQGHRSAQTDNMPSETPDRSKKICSRTEATGRENRPRWLQTCHRQSSQYLQPASVPNETPGGFACHYCTFPSLLSLAADQSGVSHGRAKFSRPILLKASRHNCACGTWRLISAGNAFWKLEIHSVFLRFHAFFRRK